MDLAKIRKKAKKGTSKKPTAKVKPKPKPEKAKPPEESGEEPVRAPVPPKARKRTAKRAKAAVPVNSEALQARPSSAPPEQDEGKQSPEKTKAESAPGRADGRGEKLLIFRLGTERYAIPIHDITQIIDEPAITPVPNAPPFLLGIISLRGKIVSVIDVASRLGLGRVGEEGEKKIVVLDVGKDRFGLLVENIDRLVEVDLQALEPPPEGFLPLPQEFVEGVLHHDGKAVAFLNLPLFLSFSG